MLSIVPQTSEPHNGSAYTDAIEKARSALRRAVSGRVETGGSFGDREVALLAAANERVTLWPHFAAAYATDVQAAA